MNKDIVQGQIHFLCQVPPDLLLCWLDCQRALVDESVFHCQYHSTIILHAHISSGR
jgi:hypothetical protein